MPNNPFSPFPPQVLYVDSNYMKSILPIAQNIDELLMRSAIQTSQSKYVMPVIGSGLDGFIQQEIFNGSISGDTWNYQLLTNFLQPLAAYAAGMELLPHLMFQVKNKGLQVKKSEFAESAKKEDLIFMIEVYKDTWQFWAKRTTLWIQDNIAQFPLYSNPGSYLDIVNPNQTSYDGFGLHIPNQTRNGTGQMNGTIYGLGLSFDIN